MHHAQISEAVSNKPVPSRRHSEEAVPYLGPNAVEVKAIDKIVGEGRQADLTSFFATYLSTPARLGDWEIRVNERLVDGVPVERKVFATPLSVRSRKIFRAGAIKVLRDAGFSGTDAELYYLRAWKKKYVWVPDVISAVLEMCTTFNNTVALDSYLLAGDPRRTAMTVGIPANPYLTTHQQFLVAVDMARRIIRERAPKMAEGKPTPDAPSKPAMVPL